MSDNDKIFSIKVGDRLPALRIQLLKCDGTVFDLTGYTVRVTIAPCVGGRAIVRDANAPLVDAPNGICEYAWAAGTTDLAGEYKVEAIVNNGTLEATFPGDDYGQVVITPRL